MIIVICVANGGSLGVVEQLIMCFAVVVQFLEVDVYQMVLNCTNGGFDVERDALHIIVGFAHGVDG